MKESKFWALVHNLVAHPILAVTSAAWATNFHDWTAERAWPGTTPEGAE